MGGGPTHRWLPALERRLDLVATLDDATSAISLALLAEEARVVGSPGSGPGTNTVRYQGLSQRIPRSPLRPHSVRAKVRMHEEPDGRLAVSRGPRRLARYATDGALIDQDALWAA